MRPRSFAAICVLAALTGDTIANGACGTIVVVRNGLRQTNQSTVDCLPEWRFNELSTEVEVTETTVKFLGGCWSYLDGYHSQRAYRIYCASRQDITVTYSTVPEHYQQIINRHVCIEFMYPSGSDPVPITNLTVNLSAFKSSQIAVGSRVSGDVSYIGLSRGPGTPTYGGYCRLNLYSDTQQGITGSVNGNINCHDCYLDIAGSILSSANIGCGGPFDGSITCGGSILGHITAASATEGSGTITAAGTITGANIGIANFAGNICSPGLTEDDLPNVQPECGWKVCSQWVIGDDTDGDGYHNCEEECDNDPNKTEPGVCGCGVPDTDSDGDGTANCIDGCPNDPDKTEPGVCGCGVPDTDVDMDSMLDCEDNCPTVYNPDQTDTDGDDSGNACDPDDDEDGIDDPIDNCPLISNSTQTDTDGDGVGDACDNCLNVLNPDQRDTDRDGIGDVCENVIYVKWDASGLNNGTSWTNAYTSLQAALAAAEAAVNLASNPPVKPDIWVAASPNPTDYYKPSVPSGRAATFTLKNNVSVYGGFAGTEEPATFRLADRDFTTKQTVLSGDIGTPGSNADNCYHVVTGSNTDSTALLDGFTITAGNANGSATSEKRGGGLYLAAGSPAIVNCVIKGNIASDYGGGAFVTGAGTPTFRNCVVETNQVGSYGGGFAIADGATPSVLSCVFRGNKTTTSGSLPRGGGAICAANCPTAFSFVNCAIVGNSTPVRGRGHLLCRQQRCLPHQRQGLHDRSEQVRW